MTFSLKPLCAVKPGYMLPEFHIYALLRLAEQCLEAPCRFAKEWCVRYNFRHARCLFPIFYAYICTHIVIYPITCQHFYEKKAIHDAVRPGTCGGQWRQGAIQRLRACLRGAGRPVGHRRAAAALRLEAAGTGARHGAGRLPGGRGRLGGAACRRRGQRVEQRARKLGQLRHRRLRRQAVEARHHVLLARAVVEPAGRKLRLEPCGAVHHGAAHRGRLGRESLDSHGECARCCPAYTRPT